MAFCTICGKSISDTAAFCPFCGKKVESAAVPVEGPKAALVPEQPDYTYTPVGFTPEPARVPQKREPAWQADPRTQEAVAKAGKAATQTIDGVMGAYKRALKVLAKKPVMLWGLSLLYSLLTCLAVVFSVLPIIWIPIIMVLELGVSAIYLSGIRGHGVKTEDLFAGFSGFFKNACGMGWRTLWLIIWGLVLGVAVGLASAAITHGVLAIELAEYQKFSFLRQLVAVAEIFLSVVVAIAVGILFIGKSYAYQFVPYVLLSDETLNGICALKKAVSMAKGYKLKMFVSDVAIALVYAVIVAAFAGLSSLTDGFIVFRILLVILGALGGLFGPLFFGLLHAAFYEMAREKAEAEAE